MGSPGAHFGSKLRSTKGLMNNYVKDALCRNLPAIMIVPS